MNRLVGPNLKKFIIHKMSVDAIPDGGGSDAGFRFLSTPGAIAEGWRAAEEFCDHAIRCVRDADDPNPWRDASEDEIASEILRRIDSYYKHSLDS